MYAYRCEYIYIYLYSYVYISRCVSIYVYSGRWKFATHVKEHVGLWAVGLGYNFVSRHLHSGAVEGKAGMDYCVGEMVSEGRKRRGWEVMGMREGKLGADGPETDIFRQVPILFEVVNAIKGTGGGGERGNDEGGGWRR